MNRDKQAFKDWIEKDVGLGQYYELFVENGIESMKVVELLEERDLIDMGITKIGHQIKFLNAIDSL